MNKTTPRAYAALALAVAAAALTGCGAIEKLEEKQLEADRRECSNYGFAPATDAFAGCMQRIQSERQRRWAEAERQKKEAEAQKNQPPQAMDCKTSETVSSSSDGTSTTTKSRTTCVGM